VYVDFLSLLSRRLVPWPSEVCWYHVTRLTFLPCIYVLLLAGDRLIVLNQTLPRILRPLHMPPLRDPRAGLLMLMRG
jgi:hypothetical protein